MSPVAIESKYKEQAAKVNAGVLDNELYELGVEKCLGAIGVLIASQLIEKGKSLLEATIIKKEKKAAKLLEKQQKVQASRAIEMENALNESKKEAEDKEFERIAEENEIKALAENVEQFFFLMR